MKHLSKLCYLMLLLTVTGCGGGTEEALQPPPPVDPANSAALTEASASPPETIDVVEAVETSGTGPQNNFAPASHETELPNTNVFEGTWTGDLDELAKRRLIRVLTVYSVGRYYLDAGQEKGMTYELLERFEDYVNAQFKRKTTRINVVFVPVARNQLIPALLEGRGDLIVAGLSITPERRQVIDFSIPVSKDVEEILVTGPTAPELNSIEDLSGKTLYVRHSSSYRQSVDELNLRFAEEGKDPVQIEPVSELLEDDDLIQMVNSGLLPWAIVDDYKPQLWTEVFPDLKVRDDIVFRSGARLGWGLRLNSPRLEQTVDRFVKQNRQGTLIGNILSNRYLRDFDWAANALEQDNYERFSKLEPYFRKYGEQYDIDYLLAAAQGYQESRLDQSMRSRSGAIGVMQMLRSTAGDKSVNIPNIDETEANIHAGIKYMAFLRDRYFSDPEIEARDQLLLSLGAYNVGPGRMIKLRNKASKQGYDPNVWFDNVEIMAAKNVGREPVNYVSNIYKYYVSYRLSSEQHGQREEARNRAGI